jgi:rRNA processing protein Krr1/Pno1
VPSRGQAPAFIPAVGDNHISLAGDRAAVLAARLEIERLTQELQRQLTLDQCTIDKGRHQFIIGNRGISAQDFHAETGCAIILPGNDEDDVITVVGPADQLDAAMERAMDLAMGMQNSRLDLTKHLRNAPSPRDHARNLTHYLRDREEIARIERIHQAHIVTPFASNGAAEPWELYSRDGKNALKAQNEIKQLLEAHPPNRMTALDIDEFFHKHLQKEFSQRVQNDYGVHLVIPKGIKAAPVVLVFEGDEGQAPEYEVPRGQPSAADLKLFKQGLEDARKHILDSIRAQGKIVDTKIDVPQM